MRQQQTIGAAIEISSRLHILPKITNQGLRQEMFTLKLMLTKMEMIIPHSGVNTVEILHSILNGGPAMGSKLAQLSTKNIE